jgi:hypothetical protein
MFKKMLDARRALAYGLGFRKFKHRLNMIKLLCFSNIISIYIEMQLHI